MTIDCDVSLALQREEEVQEAAKSAETGLEESALPSSKKARQSDVITLDEIHKYALTRFENVEPLAIGDTIEYYHRIFRNQTMKSKIQSMDVFPKKIRLENGDSFEGTDIITRGDDTGPLSSFEISDRNSRRSIGGSSSKKRTKSD